MVTVGTLGTCASSPCARARSAATAVSATANHVCTLSAYTPGRKRAAMLTGPSGRGVSALSGAGRPPESRGRAGRARCPRFPAGASACRGSIRPSGMGSPSSTSACACARLRRDAKAGGVARARSTHARTCADSRGPSVIRPPATTSAAGASGRAVLPPTAAASTSASAVFIWGG
eukprot:5504699-Pleurochrysis_carterae.AAC.1